MDTKVLFMLVATTYGGDTKVTQGIEGLGACEVAKSIVLTGKTPEENKAADEMWKQVSAERERKWREDHPPREPANDSEKAAAKMGISFAWGGASFSARDGLIQDLPPWAMTMSGPYDPSKGEDVVTVRGIQVRKYAADVKSAECTEDPGAN